MSKLVIHMDPVMPTQIFEADKNMEKIAQIDYPIDIFKFLNNNYKDNQNPIEIEFIGPKDFISKWIVEAKQLDFVKVSN